MALWRYTDILPSDKFPTKKHKCELVAIDLDRSGCSMTVHRDRVIYLTGGFSILAEKDENEDDDDLDLLSTSEAFDSPFLSMEKVPDMNVPRHSHSSAILVDKLFLFAGYTQDVDIPRAPIEMLKLKDPDELI